MQPFVRQTLLIGEGIFQVTLRSVQILLQVLPFGFQVDNLALKHQSTLMR